MAPDPDDDRRRTFAPVEVASFLRAPYGWTNRMRRAEGYPDRGARRGEPLSRTASVVLPLLVYGPLVLGAVWGWQRGGGWSGALLGFCAGLAAALIVLLVALPVAMLVRSRRP